ncbi:MAG: hypothetical protein K0Q76_3777 [Panacagrimonas sp.]|nr:hypothetical protein [Panacagrimonas sp.]
MFQEYDFAGFSGRPMDLPSPPARTDVPLEAVLLTQQLRVRPQREPDYRGEASALSALADALARSPGTILQTLAEITRTTLRVGTAGISLLSEDGTQIRWPAIAGAWSRHIGSGLPRSASPCGVVIDRCASELFHRPDRVFTGSTDPDYPIEEALLAPFSVDGRPVGTVWAVAHDESRTFDAEDQRLLISLATFAAGAYQVVSGMAHLEVQGHALRDSRSELEAERSRLQAILDTIPAGLIMLDEHGAPLIENDEWKQTWTGTATLDAAPQYDRYKGFRPDTGERIADHEWPVVISLKQGNAMQDVVLDIERFDGTRGTIVVSSAPILDSAGRVKGAVAANMDISELRSTQQRLQEAHKRKDEFLEVLSHELRNPLAPIQTSLYILDRVEAGGQQAQHAKDVISRQVMHLSRLVDDLLDVTRIARGKVELRRSRLDLVALVRRTAQDYHALARERGLDLVVLPSVETLVLDADETRLAQVLGNLISNAVKFTRTGGRVTLAVCVEAGLARIRVRDSGVGIAPDLLPSIFEPFTQAKQELARGEGGLGLGLALVKGLVELHGGAVTVRSTPAAGTEFTVDLPLPRLPTVQAPDDAIASAGAGDRVHRVLVIDDNHDAADSLAELISGYEVARSLRSILPSTARLIALSGYARPDDVKKSFESGFDAHIAKPADLQRIQRLLAEH